VVLTCVAALLLLLLIPFCCATVPPPRPKVDGPYRQGSNAAACCCREGWDVFVFRVFTKGLSAIAIVPHSAARLLLLLLQPVLPPPLHTPTQVTARTVKGQTPLHVAVEMAESSWLNRDFNYGLSIQLMLAAGADVDAADSVGSTPLQVGVLDTKLFKLLPSSSKLMSVGVACVCVGGGGRCRASWQSGGQASMCLCWQICTQTMNTRMWYMTLCVLEGMKVGGLGAMVPVMCWTMPPFTQQTAWAAHHCRCVCVWGGGGGGEVEKE